MPHMVTHGPAIEAIRKAQHLKVVELAARAQVSAPYLTNIEKGKKQPAATTALTIAHALGVPPEAITYQRPCTCTCEHTRAVAS